VGGRDLGRKSGLENGITMSLWTRVTNIFRPSRVDQDIDEELAAHLEEARARGRDPHEARKAFGSPLRSREAAHDAVVIPWLESLVADIRFGFRQLWKRRTSTAVAVLSLALGMGSCIASFRLMDSILFRPLPVEHPGQLRVMGVGRLNEFGRQQIGYSGAYEPFQLLRNAVKDAAELIAINAPYRTDLTYSTEDQMEQAFRQYVSGSMFQSFGLRPALGRLLSEQDETAPGASPYAVLSFHYWVQRFGRDPAVLGRSLRTGNDVFQIVGVAPEGFTGTEPGVMTDFFVPIMMNKEVVGNPDYNWFRTWVRLKANADAGVVRQRLATSLLAYRTERANTFPPGTPRQVIDDYLKAEVVLESASAGVSALQQSQRVSLWALGTVAGLVLLIACVNVANLMAAQTESRATEMALRVSIGAGQGRLIRLVLVEGCTMALMASAAGLAFAWWSAPFVAGLVNPPSDPIRLAMPLDWRVAAFGVALTFAVALLFGLAPALRASSVKPASALRAGLQPARVRTNWLVAAQVAFCFLVCLSSALFSATFQHMANQPLGFSSDRILTLNTVANAPRPVEDWYSVVARLRTVPGVESSALSLFPLMSGSGMNLNVAIAGRQFAGTSSPWFLGVSPGWLETMKIPILDGRDFRWDDAFPNVAAVNRTFAQQYFEGSNPVGRTFDVRLGPNRIPVRIVALTGDARYTGMREPIAATAYIPFRRIGSSGADQFSSATLTVRTEALDPMSLAASLRQAIPQSGSGLRVANIRTQEELTRRHTLRERLLATVSAFFACVAVILAGVGVYGTLTQSVLRRRREFGIRVALGASASDVVGRLVTGAFAMTALGAVLGFIVSIASESYIRSLLYEVKATDLFMLAVPLATILAATGLAALPPAIRAMRTDPARLLKLE
jgi:predicted permease